MKPTFSCLFALTCWVLPLQLAPIALSAEPPSEPLPHNIAAFNLSQAGLNHYQAGQYPLALEQWQQALQQLGSEPSLDRANLLTQIAFAQTQLGDWAEAHQSFQASLSLIQTLPTSDAVDFLRAKTLMGQGDLHYVQGQGEAALTDLAAAEALYRRLGDSLGQHHSRINQAKVLHSQGFNTQAEEQLQAVALALGSQADSVLKVELLRELGNLAQFTQGYEAALAYLDEAWAVAIQLGDAQQLALTAFDRGNLHYKHSAEEPDHIDLAEADYAQVLAHSNDPSLRLQVAVNRWYFWVQGRRSPHWTAEQIRSVVEEAFVAAPIDRTNLQARISDTMSLLTWQQQQRQTPAFADLAERLALAITGAQQLQDQATESYGLGYLGSLYQQTQDLETALDLTQRALTLAKILNAPEIVYRWQWQQGRILREQGQWLAAEQAYEAAISSLERLRADLASLQGETRFSFREEVEPVYREYVSLLLTPRQESGAEPVVSQDNLKQARRAIESLQVAELVNFFQANCVAVQEVDADQVDPKAGVIYTIILDDRLEILLSQPNQEIYHQSVPVRAQNINSAVNTLQARLRQALGNFRPPSQFLYDHLIQPLEAELDRREIETLVFVLDGPLRNIPMAVLHDGERFLVEKYALGLTPGLQLFDPKPLAAGELVAFLGGLSEAQQGFAPLPNVELEIAAIQKSLPTTVFFNEGFQEKAVSEQVIKDPTAIVHFATHGQFSSKAEDNFILTWDDQINIEELSQLLQGGFRKDGQAIELLIFSACETAAGDDRAVLGLAGLAVRSGARSTLATLWQVSDEGTAVFMEELYGQLAQGGMTKAEAVRQAQLAMLRDHGFTHPFYWAPFVLVGNWL